VESRAEAAVCPNGGAHPCKLFRRHGKPIRINKPPGRSRLRMRKASKHLLYYSKNIPAHNFHCKKGNQEECPKVILVLSSSEVRLSAYNATKYSKAHPRPSLSRKTSKEHATYRTTLPNHDNHSPYTRIPISIRADQADQ